MGMGHGRDRRHVLDLEGLRARRFDIDDLGVGPDQIGDPGADQGIVVGRLDPEAGEHAIAELPGRPIGAVDHQKMVAGLQEAGQRLADRGLAGAGDHRAMAAFQHGDRILEREGGRHAAAAIGYPAQAARRLERCDARIEDGRGAIDRRIDRAMVLFGRAAGGDQKRVVVHGALSGTGNEVDFPVALWQEAVPRAAWTAGGLGPSFAQKAPVALDLAAAWLAS